MPNVKLPMMDIEEQMVRAMHIMADSVGQQAMAGSETAKQALTWLEQLMDQKMIDENPILQGLRGLVCEAISAGAKVSLMGAIEMINKMEDKENQSGIDH